MRRIEGEWSCLWVDATCLKVRQGSRITSIVVTIAVGVHKDGRRDVPGMAHPEALSRAGRAFLSVPDAGRCLVVDSGWDSVAQKALTFIEAQTCKARAPHVRAVAS